MTMPEIVYALLIVLFDVLTMYMLLGVRFKDVKKLKYMFFLLIFALTLMGSAFVAKKYGLSTYIGYFPLLVQVPIYFMFYPLSKYRGTKFLFVFLSTFIFSSPVLWSPFFVGAFVNYSMNIMLAAALIAYVMMLIVIKKVFSPLFHFMLENLQKKWLLLSVLPISYSVLSYLTDDFNYTIAGWQESSYFRILILAIVYSAYMVIFLFFKQTREQFMLQNEQTVFAMQLDAMKLHLSALEESQTKTAIYRHDLRHHLQLIGSYLAEHNEDAIKKYIAGLEQEIEDTVVTLYCENKAVNLILSSYVAKAKKNHILLKVHTDIPQTIPIASNDLCVLLSNTLENAMNATKSLPEGKNREITIACYPKNDKLFLEIVNNYEGEIVFANGLPQSEKAEHGVGTKSITAIVDKYKGMYSFEAKNGVFSLAAII